jgi:hypothetical protein
MALRTSSRRILSLLNDASLRGAFGRPASSPLRKPGPAPGFLCWKLSPVA